MPCEAPWAKQGHVYMHYVYLLRSIDHREQSYIGMTTDLDDRMKAHNEGRSKHTAKWRPWKLVAYVAVDGEEKARELEKYFKSGSGHAFARKRLW